MSTLTSIIRKHLSDEPKTCLDLISIPEIREIVGNADSDVISRTLSGMLRAKMNKIHRKEIPKIQGSSLRFAYFVPPEPKREIKEFFLTPEIEKEEEEQPIMDKIKSVRAYKTSDGHFFENKNEALRHEAKMEFLYWYEVTDRPRIAEPMAMVDWLQANRQKVLDLLRY